MALVELLLPALPAHVRTARLVVVAAARRAGLEDELVDEVRLAVGEACARAVELEAEEPGAARVMIAVDEGPEGLSISVSDGGRPTEPAEELGEKAFGPEGDSAEVALAVLEGLVDRCEVTHVPEGGTTVRMTWPLRAQANGRVPSAPGGVA